mgnify:CR=1 FL=1
MQQRLVILCAALALGAVSSSAQQAPATDPIVAKALAIHERVITLDTHVDIAGANYATPALDPGADFRNRSESPYPAGGVCRRSP